MKKISALLCLLFMTIALSSCDTLLAISQGLSGGAAAYGNAYNGYSSGYPYSSSAGTSSSDSEWHNCYSCGGSGRCKNCGGSGKDSYMRSGNCGVCRGTGRCAGCNGKGGYSI